MTVEENLRFANFVKNQEQSTSPTQPPPGRERIGILISKHIVPAEMFHILS